MLLVVQLHRVAGRACVNEPQRTGLGAAAGQQQTRRETEQHRIVVGGLGRKAGRYEEAIDVGRRAEQVFRERQRLAAIADRVVGIAAAREIPALHVVHLPSAHAILEQQLAPVRRLRLERGRCKQQRAH